MKKLIATIVLCTIMLAGFVMPVYAQEDAGYPVDYPEPLCSGVGGEGPGSFVYAVALIVSIAVVGWWIVGKFIAKDEE